MEFPRLSTQRRALLAQAADKYSEALEGSVAAEYLAGRGIPLEVAQGFQLGYVDEPMEGHDWFKGRLAIPYLTPSGVSLIRFRSLEPDPKRKYDQEKGMRTPLFNVRDLHKSDPWVVVCEGELDTVVMSGIVGVPAVGIPGVDHWNTNKLVWARLLQDYSAVYICLDPDDAGQKIVGDIQRLVENPVIINLPADVNDTVLTEGVDFILSKMGLD